MVKWGLGEENAKECPPERIKGRQVSVLPTDASFTLKAMRSIDENIRVHNITLEGVLV